MDVVADDAVAVAVGEGGAGVGAVAVGVDGAAVKFNDGFGDGQAESEAAELAGDGAFGLFEGLEIAWEGSGLYADATVSDLGDDGGGRG